MTNSTLYSMCSHVWCSLHCLAHTVKISKLLTGFCHQKCANFAFQSIYSFETTWTSVSNQSINCPDFIFTVYQIRLSIVVVESGVQGHEVIVFLNHNDIYSVLSVFHFSCWEVLNVLILPYFKTRRVALKHKSWPIPLKKRHQWSGSKLIHSYLCWIDYKWLMCSFTEVWFQIRSDWYVCLFFCHSRWMTSTGEKEIRQHRQTVCAGGSNPLVISVNVIMLARC